MNENDLKERRLDDRERRNKALSDLDMNWARGEYPEAYSDAVLLAAMHKARVDCVDLSDALRLESVEWLRERGLRRIYGMPLPPPGVLPV